MPPDFRTLLPALLPLAVSWAEARASEATANGRQLTPGEMVLAQQVGVHHPERIRIAAVAHLPLPEHPGLRAAALHTGLLGPDMVGLTLGYAVYVRAGHATQRLLSHEFRHVYQYEHAGALPDYLRTYLQQLLQYGYALAPYAVDARLHEQADS